MTFQRRLAIDFGSGSLAFVAHNAFAQQNSGAGGCAACGACGAGIGVLIALVVGFFALNIALLVWVARDAKARNLGSGVGWMVLVLFTGLIGLLIYSFSRPKGNLVACSSCGNKRLEGSAKCPHCGNA